VSVPRGEILGNQVIEFIRETTRMRQRLTTAEEIICKMHMHPTMHEGGTDKRGRIIRE
jgi:hypothetical protein